MSKDEEKETREPIAPLTIVYGNENFPKTARSTDDRPPYIDPANYGFKDEGMRIAGSGYRFSFVKGEVEEFHNKITQEHEKKYRIVARVLPEPVVLELDAIDEKIDELEDQLKQLLKERDALLVAAIPGSRKVKRSDLKSPEDIREERGLDPYWRGKKADGEMKP